jgi:hypothetical protein
MRKIQAGNYTFVSKPSKFTQLTSATNILLDNLKGSTVNYTKAPLPNITTDKFVLAVDSPDDSHRYTVYAYEDTTSPIGITVSEGWWWFNTDTNQLISIDPPTIPIKSDCTLLSTVTDEEYNALFTEPFIVEAPKEYKRVWSQGQRDTNINDFEAMPEVNTNMSYNITDYPNTGITNAQMEFALTAKRLFTEGETFICLDDGVYTKGHIYKLNIVNDSKSWEDITDGIKIYAVTDILNTDGIKSGTFTEEQINNIKLADILQVYCIDGDPIYKYAYKGLYPTNPAQSTIGANLYFVAATEKGNYVLAINTDTRDWEVREPASIQQLYKHELVIPYSFSVGDSETVNGSVVYHYLSNTGTQITSASEIDDNFLLSGGVGKNSGSDALTWVINEKPSIPDKMFSVKFTSDAIRYNTIILSPTGDAVPDTSDVLIAYHQEDGMFDQVYEIYQGTERWGSQAYRTITFETAPSGDLLTWLQANAVPQSEVNPNTDLTWIINDTNATPPTTRIETSIKFSVQNDPENIGTNFDTISISNTEYTSGIQYNSITTGWNHVADFDGNSLIWNTKGADTSAYRTITFETAPSGDLLTWLQANAVPQGGADSSTVLLFNVNVTKAGSSITVEAVNASTMGYITGTVGTITDTITQLI